MGLVWEEIDIHSQLCQKQHPTVGGVLLLERGTGVEPAYAAWEAAVLPMN